MGETSGSNLKGVTGTGVGDTPGAALKNAAADATSKTNSLTDKTAKNTDAKDKDYDKKTSHGGTQGAVLDTRVK